MPIFSFFFFTNYYTRLNIFFMVLAFRYFTFHIYFFFFFLSWLFAFSQTNNQASKHPYHTYIFFYRSTAEQAALLGDRAGTAGWAFTF